MKSSELIKFPKGINRDTATIILRVFAQCSDGREMSIREVNSILGISRGTLRKYFSFLENRLKERY